MTLVQITIVVVACFLSTFWIIVSYGNSLEKRIDKFHRQELEAIDELKKSLENKGCYIDPPVIKSWQPWQCEEFGPYRWTLTPRGTEDDILYTSHSKDKEGVNG